MPFDSITKLAKLRQQLEAHELDAYIVPTEDPHSSEYPVKADARREYISNFTGSAGTALVGREKAWLWTDGRYFLQAARELDNDNWTLMKAGTKDCPTLTDLLKSENLKRTGFDPFVHTSVWLNATKKSLAGTSITLVPIHGGSKKRYEKAEDLQLMEGLLEGQENLVDLVWAEDGTRPDYPKNPLVPMRLEYSGLSVQDKLKSIRAKMTAKKSAILILASLGDIAWLYNVRGQDAQYSRIFLSYAIVTQDKALLFLKESSCQARLASVLDHLKEADVTLRDYNDLGGDLLSLVEALDSEADLSKLWIDSSVNLAVTVLAKSAMLRKGKEKVVEETSPVRLMKAIKNPVELTGITRAHVYDGVALACFFAWLQSLKLTEFAELNEVTASDKLRSIREKMTDFVALSFETIAGVDSNGAVIHYRPELPAARKLNPKGMFLLDSGAHYEGGTTDVTRTVHFGIPTPWEKELYTRVLMGHIDLASVVFPKKIYGCQLDVLSRQPLWEIGMDFLHGTGHGVGHSLEVHEAPPSISGRCPPSSFDVPIEAGMVVSDEPGAYLDGKFGIRIENLMFARQQHTPLTFNDAEYLSFEMLTLSPYCRRLIEPSLMSPKQLKYLNTYHEFVLSTLTPEIKALADRGLSELIEPTLSWLRENCKPIA